MKKIGVAIVLLALCSSTVLAYFTYPKIGKLPQVYKVSFRTTPYKLIVKNDAKDKRARLFAVYKKKEVKILRPEELLSIIPPLRNSQEVMHFARLFTDGNSHTLFMSPAALEIFIADKGNLYLLNDDNYGWGLINPARAQALSVSPSVIIQKKKTYTIKRTVVFYPQPEKVMRLSEITETINPKKHIYLIQESRSISDALWVQRMLQRLGK